MALYHGEQPKHLAETIVLEPTVKVPNRRDRHWVKRDVKIHHAKTGQYWAVPLKHRSVKFDQWATNNFVNPLTAVPIKRQRKIKPQPRPENPLPIELDRPRMDGLYGYEQYWADTQLLEGLRAQLRTWFVNGQPKYEGQIGPMTDGIIYKGIDDQFLAKLKDCERKLRATQGIMQKAKEVAKLKFPTPKQAESKHWRDIGNQPEVAQKFKTMGFKTRLIEAGRAKSYQILYRNK